MEDKTLIHNITNLTTKTKGKGDLVTTITFDAKVPVPTLTKLLILQASGAPLLISITPLQGTLPPKTQEPSENG